MNESTDTNIYHKLKKKSGFKKTIIIVPFGSSLGREIEVNINYTYETKGSIIFI